MIGYKAFDKNLKCKGFQYEIGRIYKFDGEPIPCKQGFHFCKSIAETYNYYSMNEGTRICKIEAIGDIATDDDIKHCTNEIKIIEEITEDWIKKGNTNSSSSGYCNTGYCDTGDHNTGYCNAGDHNTGYCNAGDWNAGDHNTGDWNAGDRNTGSYNTGYFNTGRCNTGRCNTGSCNTGSCNAGDRNTGYNNIGSWNAGDRNTGDYNTGSCNIGDYNTGDWNATHHSSGCFNTKEKDIWMFDKPTEWTLDEWRHSEAYHILKGIPRKIVEWINEENMSDKEKEKYPSYKTTGGYLKELDERESAQDYWDGLSKYDKQIVYDLPNFDKDIFKECTGIDVKSIIFYNVLIESESEE